MEKQIKVLEWNEHIRLRPGMYLGSVDMRGFIELLKGIYSNTLTKLSPDILTFELRGTHTGKITLENITQPVLDSWSKFNAYKGVYFLELGVLNAISQFFTVQLGNESNEIQYKQQFEKGILTQGIALKEALKCSKMEISFTLDATIWGDDFQWNHNYLHDEIKEFAYLYQKVKFKLLHQIENESCKTIYYFKNGLKDKIESLKAYDSSFLDVIIEKQFNDFYFEAALSFKSGLIPGYLKSYVNDYYTPEGGSHVDGLLTGLTNALLKYGKENNIQHLSKITKKVVQEKLFAVVHVKLDNPTFSGCTKSKLDNNEIVESIANHAEHLLLGKLEENESSANTILLDLTEFWEDDVD